MNLLLRWQRRRGHKFWWETAWRRGSLRSRAALGDANETNETNKGALSDETMDKLVARETVWIHGIHMFAAFAEVVVGSVNWK